MTRAALLARTSSQELTGWWALFEVHAEEAERQQDLAESGDGVVIVHGRDPERDDEDDEDQDDDGGPETE